MKQCGVIGRLACIRIVSTRRSSHAAVQERSLQLHRANLMNHSLHPLLRPLNAEQRAAAMHRSGTAICVAGPGSGKTRTLIARAGLLLEEGVDPQRILVVTFTKKAAGELKDRLTATVGAKKAREVVAGTFHSLCARWLRRDAPSIGRKPNFTIYDEDDSKRVVTAVFKALDLETKGGKDTAVRAQISAWKNKGWQPADVERRVDLADFPAKQALHIYGAYEERLKEANALDFDDLLLCFLEVLRADPRVLSAYQRRWDFVMADESQDDNDVQNAILLLLSEATQSLFVIGDSQQGIYGFRGAMPDSLAAIHRARPQAIIYRLGQNYRSTQEIVTTAQRLIDQAPDTEKAYTTRIWSENEAGEPVGMLTPLDEDHEAAQIADLIARDLAAGFSPSRWAVLCRVNAMTRPIEQALFRYRIPYRIIGGTPFIERAEVRDVMAYLRLAANPDDEAAFRRVANVPGRGFGEASVDKVIGAARRTGRTLVDLVCDLDGPLTPVKIPGRAVAGALAFAAVIAWMQQQVMEVPLADLIVRLLERLEFLNHLGETYGKEQAEERWLNVQSLVAFAADFAERPIEEQLPTFLDELMLLSAADRPEGDDAGVSVMTIHASKGLEFDCVAVIGLDETVIPWRKAALPDEIHEERRVLFVAMTRARKRLYLTHASTRRLYRDRDDMAPSRFLATIFPGRFLTTFSDSDAEGDDGDDE